MSHLEALAPVREPSLALRGLLAITAVGTMVAGLAAIGNSQAGGESIQEVAANASTDDFNYFPYCFDGPPNVFVESTAGVDQDVSVDGLSETLSPGESFTFPAGSDRAGIISSSLGSSAAFELDDNCEFIDTTTTTTTTTTSEVPQEKVCDELDSGKIDVQGSVEVLTITADPGELITRYCVKAGSSNQGLGPEYIDVVPPVMSLDISHSSGKDISHYSFKTEEGTEVTTTTEVIDTTPSTSTTSTTTTTVRPTTTVGGPTTTVRPTTTVGGPTTTVRPTTTTEVIDTTPSTSTTSTTTTTVRPTTTVGGPSTG